MIFQMKYKYKGLLFKEKGRDIFSPLLIYRTLNLVTFFWIGNPLLIDILIASVLKES